MVVAGQIESWRAESTKRTPLSAYRPKSVIALVRPWSPRLANSRLKSMGECLYSVRSGAPKSHSKAGELEQMFLGTITPPIGGTEKRAKTYSRAKPKRKPGPLERHPLDPVGPQVPPTRGAASAHWKGTPRRAWGPPVDYGDKLVTEPQWPTFAPPHGPFLLRRERLMLLCTIHRRKSSSRYLGNGQILLSTSPSSLSIDALTSSKSGFT